jgi:hypothetical protein
MSIAGLSIIRDFQAGVFTIAHTDGSIHFCHLISPTMEAFEHSHEYFTQILKENAGT